MRLLTAILGGAVLISVVASMANIKGSPQPATHADATRQKTTAQKQDDNPLANVRQWYAYLDGNRIACYADPQSGHRWFIILPTPEQRADGEVMVTNDNPSDDAWNSYCSKQPVIAHW